ncbi:hypothetical protein RND71_025853 [Anisodus tanguticus]|uniref:Transmembrane protein n=1 Tax=Anisodus tanguticus TaxID=243964 RepID=A0AAE1RM50_9SOLA|nr:hypothetical protein RND71_025853 [Anisodus tanguticus]
MKIIAFSLLSMFILIPNIVVMDNKVMGFAIESAEPPKHDKRVGLRPPPSPKHYPPIHWKRTRFVPPTPPPTSY